MAKGKKTGGRDIEPGQVLNPGGRPKVPEDIREAKKLDQLELDRILNRLLNSKRKELKVLYESGVLTNKEEILASIILHASAKGDQYRMDFILNRLIGKPTERVAIVNPDQDRPLRDLSDEELDRL